MQSAAVLGEEAWALIPARGGSKSIPLKNMVELGGRPLISYVIQAAKNSRSISRILCSTDNDRIGAFCARSGVEVQERPVALAGDEVATLDVVLHVLQQSKANGDAIPSIMALLEPTSPFVLPKQIDECVALLRENPDADSVQTITTVPPNHHAYNQRYLEGGMIYFRYKEERRRLHNKQMKPAFYVHGNLRVLRSASVLEKRDLFGDRSLPYLIPRTYALDVDGPEDLELAELLVRSGKVELNHLQKDER